jgi:hypothetical protein
LKIAIQNIPSYYCANEIKQFLSKTIKYDLHQNATIFEIIESHRRINTDIESVSTAESEVKELISFIPNKFSNDFDYSNPLHATEVTSTSPTTQSTSPTTQSTNRVGIGSLVNIGSMSRPGQGITTRPGPGGKSFRKRRNSKKKKTRGRR